LNNETILSRSIAKQEGYSNKLKALKPLTNEHHEYLSSRGIETSTCEEFNIHSTADGIVFPYIKDAEIVGYKERISVEKEGKKSKTYQQYGDCGNQLWYIEKSLKTGQVAYLVAGEIDCMTLYQYQLLRQARGLKDSNNFICTLTAGETAIIPEIELAKLKNHKVQEVRIVYDNDNTGHLSSSKIATTLTQQGIPSRIFQWDIVERQEPVKDINEFYCMYSELDDFFDVSNFASVETATKKKQMPEDEYKEAMTFLKSDRMLQEVRKDIETLGYVGEQYNTVLQYLIATSRKLDSPMSNVIKGPSAAGKSELVKTVMGMMPKDDVLFLSRISETALANMAKISLEHRWIILAELAATEGQEQARYLLRTFISEKEITSAISVKNNKTNRHETEILKVKGPIAYTETTTESNLHPENVTRMWQMYVDDSESQTKLIHTMQKMANTLQYNALKDRRIKVKKKHQNAQQLLRSIVVIIPYAQDIEFPSKLIRTRRDFPRFLEVIKSIAFLRQYQKSVCFDECGIEYIEADQIDYTFAHRIATKILFNTFSDITKQAREIHGKIVGLVNDQSLPKDEFTFTRRDMEDAFNLSATFMRRYLKELVRQEKLELVQGGKQGQKAVYRLCDEREEKEIEGLTTPEELHSKLRQKSESEVQQLQIKGK